MKIRYLVLGLTGVFLLSLFFLPKAAEAEMEEIEHMHMAGMEMKMYMPIVGMGAHVLPKGKWRIKSHWTEMEDDEILDDGNAVHPDMNMEMQKLTTKIMYGLPRDMHVSIVVPYVDNEMSGSMSMTMMGTTTVYGMSGKASGLGDISVILKKRLYHNMENGWAFAVSGGVKLPTGKDDEKFTDENTMTDNFYDDYRLPINMQPGTGEFDPLVGISCSKSDKLGSWHANAMYIYTSEADEDVDPGDKLMFHLARNFPLTDRFILVGEINGMWQGDDDYPGRNISPGLDEHGTVISLTPGLQFKPTKNSVLEVAVKFPVVTPDDGMIPKPMPYFGAGVKF